MIPTQELKYVSVIRPAAIVDNDTFASNVIDTKGFDYLTILVDLGATDIALSVLKVQEAEAASDATTLTSGADVTGTVFGTATNSAGATSTLPGATDDNKLYAIHIDLRARKRYQKLIATIGDGTVGGFVSSLGLLSRGNVVPSTAILRGLAQELIV